MKTITRTVVLRGGIGNGVTTPIRRTTLKHTTDSRAIEQARRLREQLIDEEAERDALAIRRHRACTLGRRTF